MMNQKSQTFSKYLNKNQLLAHHLGRETLTGFMFFYMSDYFEYCLGIPHLTMIRYAQDPVRHTLFTTFPDSNAEQILVYSNALWSILGNNRRTHVAIVCGTREKAREVYDELKYQLLHNSNLRHFNHGVTEQSCDGWNIKIPKFYARISVIAYPMSPSKVRYRGRSPDMVICCGLEHVKSKNSDVKDWMKDELYHKRHFYEKTIVVGEAIRNSDPIESLRSDVLAKRYPFIMTFVPCPLFSDSGECMWEEKYPDEDARELFQKCESDPLVRQQYMFNDKTVVRVPRKFFDADGRCRVDEYEKSIEHEHDLDSNRLHIIMARMTNAWEYLVFGKYHIHGTGTAYFFEPDDD